MDLEVGFCGLAKGRMKARVTQIARESLGGKKHKEIMQVVQSLAYVICWSSHSNISYGIFGWHCEKWRQTFEEGPSCSLSWSMNIYGTALYRGAWRHHTVLLFGRLKTSSMLTLGPLKRMLGLPKMRWPHHSCWKT